MVTYKDIAKAAELKTIYGFMASNTDGTFSIQLVYENLALSIGEKTFKGNTLSVYEGAMYQEYYCYKIDKYMVSLVLTYTKDTAELKDEFLNNISELKE